MSRIRAKRAGPAPLPRLARNPQTLAEPSGAVAPAAWLFHRDSLPRSNAAVAVISGGNIDPELLARLRA